MKIIIIEDELLTARDLEACIRAAEPEAEVVAVLGSVSEAASFFKEHALPDLIFSDIQLGDGLSFSIFTGFEQPVPVIFTTAYDEYALEAFKVAGIDYILKPFSTKNIAAALARYKAFRRAPAPGELSALFAQSGGKRSILVYHKEKIVPVNVADIALCYLRDDAVLLLTFAKQQYSVNKRLEEIEQIVGPGFYRVNRQALVNREAVRDVSQDMVRRLDVNLLVPFDEKITVARAKVTHFLEWLAGG
ncbi:MAG TPA: LytTR family DNA-binding domain-containing protein [Puia sp.]|nr:LytTR family DNA-binding domain-containing protein [Puia sp.]